MQCVNYTGNAQLKKITLLCSSFFLKKKNKTLMLQSIYPTLDSNRVKKDTSFK